MIINSSTLSLCFRLTSLLFVVSSIGITLRQLSHILSPVITSPIVVTASRKDSALYTPSRNGLLLPPEYLENTPESRSCDDRFGLNYLSTFSESAEPYTVANSQSDLTCFRWLNEMDARNDSFCIGGPTQFNASSQRFEMNADIIDRPKHNGQPIPAWWQFPVYMYDTGPCAILHSNVDLVSQNPLKLSHGSERTAILIKREGEGNLWHCMQELFSLYLSIDIIRTTLKPSRNLPLLTDSDLAQTDIIILDNHEDGPYFSLWDVLTQGSILRVTSLPRDTIYKNLIIPLPGAASPLWQGNWATFPCINSPLLSTFSRRVLAHFSDLRPEPPHPPPSLPTPLELAPLTPNLPVPASPQPNTIITYLTRGSKRRLLNNTEHLSRLQSAHPNTTVQAFDFSTLNFTTQLQIIRATDVLVGVHGAGLTHAMFLPPDSAVVEILPGGLQVKVYRNLAKLAGHRYFGCHAEMVRAEGDWAEEDVMLEEGRFLGVVGAAVGSVRNRGWRSEDVV